MTHKNNCSCWVTPRTPANVVASRPVHNEKSQQLVTGAGAVIGAQLTVRRHFATLVPPCITTNSFKAVASRPVHNEKSQQLVTGAGAVIGAQLTVRRHFATLVPPCITTNSFKA